jgi:protein phosphatase
VGRVRDHNEDVLLTLTSTFDGDEKIPSFGLYIVADGMGGHSLGERASAVAARSVAREVTRRVYLSLLSDSDDNEDRVPLQDVLLEALTQANVAVREAVGEGGTTGTVALVFNDQVIIGHVGDSRAYLITSSGLEQLTRDHSLVRRLQELGQLTQAEAAVHPQRNVLYRAIGQGEGLEVDVYTQRLAPDTKILLCSDGLWGLVEDDQILEVVRNAPSLQAACDKLVEMANDAGGHDNITTVLIEYSP